METFKLYSLEYNDLIEDLLHVGYAYEGSIACIRFSDIPLVGKVCRGIPIATWRSNSETFTALRFGYKLSAFKHKMRQSGLMAGIDILCVLDSKKEIRGSIRKPFCTSGETVEITVRDKGFYELVDAKIALEKLKCKMRIIEDTSIEGTDPELYFISTEKLCEYRKTEYSGNIMRYFSRCITQEDEEEEKKQVEQE